MIFTCATQNVCDHIENVCKGEKEKMIYKLSQLIFEQKRVWNHKLHLMIAYIVLLTL